MLHDVNALLNYSGATAADWDNIDVPIASGMLAYAQDTKEFKFGNGADKFTDLPVAFTLNDHDHLKNLLEDFPDITVGDAGKLVIINPTGDGYVYSDVKVSDLLTNTTLTTMLVNKSPIDHTHPEYPTKSEVDTLRLNSKGLDIDSQDIVSLLVLNKLDREAATAMNLPAGFADEFEDESGIDDNKSSNVIWDDGSVVSTKPFESIVNGITSVGNLNTAILTATPVGSAVDTTKCTIRFSFKPRIAHISFLIGSSTNATYRAYMGVQDGGYVEFIHRINGSTYAVGSYAGSIVAGNTYVITFIVDTSNEVPEDRHKLYINGVPSPLRVTRGEFVPLNTECPINIAGHIHSIGRNSFDSVTKFDGDIYDALVIRGENIAAEKLNLVRDNACLIKPYLTQYDGYHLSFEDQDNLYADSSGNGTVFSGTGWSQKTAAISDIYPDSTLFDGENFAIESVSADADMDIAMARLLTRLGVPDQDVLNTSVIFEMSRDGGSNWSPVTLHKSPLSGGANINVFTGDCKFDRIASELVRGVGDIVYPPTLDVVDDAIQMLGDHTPDIDTVATTPQIAHIPVSGISRVAHIAVNGADGTNCLLGFYLKYGNEYRTYNTSTGTWSSVVRLKADEVTWEYRIGSIWHDANDGSLERALVQAAEQRNWISVSDISTAIPTDAYPTELLSDIVAVFMLDDIDDYSQAFSSARLRELTIMGSERATLPAGNNIRWRMRSATPHDVALHGIRVRWAE